MHEKVELNEKQANTIDMLASGKSVEEVAEKLRLYIDGKNLIFNDITLKFCEMCK